MRSRGLEEVVILNVDTNTLETPFDDLKRIPSDVVVNTLLLSVFMGICMSLLFVSHLTLCHFVFTV